MSYFGNYDKDDLLYEMDEFLKTHLKTHLKIHLKKHQVSELLEVVEGGRQ